MTGAELKSLIVHAVGTGWWGLDLQDELDGCVVLTREEVEMICRAIPHEQAFWWTFRYENVAACREALALLGGEEA